MNTAIVNFLDKTFYPQYPHKNWDDRLLREEILNYVDDKTTLLDLGAGSGRLEWMNFKGVAGEVYGLDPEESVNDNPYLDKAFVGLGDHMPMFDDSSFDVVISDNVLEHIDNEDKFFNEVNRVLKPGGLYITKTPNKYHYTSIIANSTPTWFHKFYNKLRGRDEDDTFPTLYKANTSGKQRKIAERTGFSVNKVVRIEGRPEYLRLLFLVYPFGIFYERIVNLFNIKALKNVLITVFKKN